MAPIHGTPPFRPSFSVHEKPSLEAILQTTPGARERVGRMKAKKRRYSSDHLSEDAANGNLELIYSPSNVFMKWTRLPSFDDGVHLAQSCYDVTALGNFTSANGLSRSREARENANPTQHLW